MLIVTIHMVTKYLTGYAIQLAARQTPGYSIYSCD